MNQVNRVDANVSKSNRQALLVRGFRPGAPLPLPLIFDDHRMAVHVPGMEQIRMKLLVMGS
jgi:hypothetical protein